MADFPSGCIVVPLLHICKRKADDWIGSGIFQRKKLLHHAHGKGLSKPPRPGDQRHLIPAFPPLLDKGRLIHIKIIVLNDLSKILYPDPYRSRHIPSCSGTVSKSCPGLLVFFSASIESICFSVNSIRSCAFGPVRAFHNISYTFSPTRRGMGHLDTPSSQFPVLSGTYRYLSYILNLYSLYVVLFCCTRIRSIALNNLAAALSFSKATSHS